MRIERGARIICCEESFPKKFQPFNVMIDSKKFGISLWKMYEKSRGKKKMRMVNGFIAAEEKVAKVARFFILLQSTITLKLM